MLDVCQGKKAGPLSQTGLAQVPGSGKYQRVGECDPWSVRVFVEGSG